MPLMLSPAGRLVGVKKLGWPKVSSFSLSSEYVRLIVLKKLIFAAELFAGRGLRTND
jgi:hypothetical protein